MGMIIGSYIILFLVVFITYVIKKNKYDKSNYKKESGNKFLGVMMDKGKYGEYLSFNILEKINGASRILTNVYLPKGNGETTEIDLVYIHETGIYVLESKNYSGWIFGDEKSKNWMQTLKNGQKQKFYNPIWQNNTHIKYLMKVLEVDESFVKSIIVFSERCTIKKMEVNSKNIKVINRFELKKTIEKLIDDSSKVFEEGKIIELYYELKPYTQVSDKVKENHIEQIKQKQNLEYNHRSLESIAKENINEKVLSEEANEDIKVEDLKSKIESEEIINTVNVEEGADNNFEIEESREITTSTENIKSDDELYKLLKEYRIKVSKEEKLKPFMVFTNQELDLIVECKPKNNSELLKIRGFEPKKLEKYEESILKIVNECLGKE
ncbi:NERD domain-containing protein [Clostridium saccharoperbutylacetonicum]|uniref:NERD domain-containing protein n=1 Tax=Clostridium saccharoperbutylacetonicum TaxID=36745 RepID=UPI000983DDCD|nr:NERD domain-containing protein [Clostridium saccharoperbutylacetonicum]AQR96503.1 ATP-dependent DNA helicase UvrD2 [Clostridium saccharoperbutylacetonicum]NSB32378.1 superfamily II DNA helicase RecQ [Clostridium saccharoperbutylacetonicum]